MSKDTTTSKRCVVALSSLLVACFGLSLSFPGVVAIADGGAGTAPAKDILYVLVGDPSPDGDTRRSVSLYEVRENKNTLASVGTIASELDGADFIYSIRDSKTIVVGVPAQKPSIVKTISTAGQENIESLIVSSVAKCEACVVLPARVVSLMDGNFGIEFRMRNGNSLAHEVVRLKTPSHMSEDNSQVSQFYSDGAPRSTGNESLRAVVSEDGALAMRIGDEIRKLPWSWPSGLYAVLSGT